MPFRRLLFPAIALTLVAGTLYVGTPYVRAAALIARGALPAPGAASAHCEAIH